MSNAPSLILAPLGDSLFHVALLGLKIKPILDIEADSKSKALEQMENILRELPSMDGWSGDFSTSGLHIINPTEESNRWLIDFSPTFDQVNAELITPTLSRSSAS